MTWLSPGFKRGLRQLASLTYPAFKGMMRADGFRRRIEMHRVPGFLNGYIGQLYERWWEETQTYDPETYGDWQARYWDTVGQYRWAGSSGFDYSDITVRLTPLADREVRLLELGCGKGDMLAAIHRVLPGARTFGVDASPAMCEAARVRSPKSTVLCGRYGPDGVTLAGPFEVVIARSTLTYIDEGDMDRVLQWVGSMATELLIISEPSGIRDNQLDPASMIPITPFVYKRRHDHTHIRDYARYPALGGFQLSEVGNERFNAGGNRLWVFRRSAPGTPQRIPG